MEWWDSVILVNDLDTIKDGKIAVKDSVINTLVEHPTQMRCPSKWIYTLHYSFYLTLKTLVFPPWNWPWPCRFHSPTPNYQQPSLCRFLCESLGLLLSDLVQRPSDLFAT